MNSGVGQFFFALTLMIVLSDAIPGRRFFICYVIISLALVFKLLDRMEQRGKEKQDAEVEYFNMLVSHGVSPSEAVEMAGMSKDYTTDSSGRLVSLPKDDGESVDL